MSEGSVKLEVYQKYLKSIDSIIKVVFILLLFVIAQVATSGLDFFVAQWVNWEESTINHSNNSMTDNSTIIAEKENIQEQRSQYLIAYTCLAVAFIYTVTHRNMAFFIQLCLNASINLHDKLFRGITRAKMLFFNNNPSGRILNRFSKDIGNIDSFLPVIMIDSVLVSSPNFFNYFN